MPTTDKIQCQICDSFICPLLIKKDNWHYYLCTDCGLVFLHPMLNKDELKSLYANPDSGGTRAYFRKEKSKVRRAKGRIQVLSKAMQGGPKGRKFLDVGCSGGFVTQAAIAAGFYAWGIDPDNDAIIHAKTHYPGANYWTGNLKDFAAQTDGGFDAVYCSEVLEHVADANGFIGSIAKLMAPDGIVFLTTPDIGHWRRPQNLLDWDVFTPPHHCLFFSAGNLRQLLSRHGLQIYAKKWAFKPGLKVLARKVSV